MDTRKIESRVEERPGITFSKLKKEFDLANGQLQYHLKNSKAVKKGRGYVTKEACRSCGLGDTCKEKCIKRVLRDEKKRKICRKLGDMPKKDIAEELSVSKPTLSYHLNKLKEAGIIEDGSVVSEVEELL